MITFLTLAAILTGLGSIWDKLSTKTKVNLVIWPIGLLILGAVAACYIALFLHLYHVNS